MPDEQKPTEAEPCLTSDLWEALYTTRAMRRLKEDPIPLEAQRRILDAAVRAPSGGNSQGWRFLLVDDPDIKAQLGPLYRDGVARLWATSYSSRLASAAANPDAPESKDFTKMVASIQHLADRFEATPLFLFGLTRNDRSGRSVLPSVWSAQLAARALGIGTALTSVLLSDHEDLTLEILGVPLGEGWVISACVAFGYPKGRWGVARRRPAHEVTYRNRWGSPAGFEDHQPLWP